MQLVLETLNWHPGNPLKATLTGFKLRWAYRGHVVDYANFPVATFNKHNIQIYPQSNYSMSETLYHVA